ncbi:ribonuclease 3-like protein 1 isoform X2 [Aristolochia californica]|uniref:ribonuclease 3-like protein 1 isoform X2 n=1 Tax=Aristolochia californica TaxID=171875 RepID=UPI0035DEABAF
MAESRDNARGNISVSKGPTFSEIEEPFHPMGSSGNTLTESPHHLWGPGGVHIEIVELSQLRTLLPLQDIPGKTAKMRLYEVCTAYCWNRPSFHCCKEEGPGHSRLFTYKVIVEAKDAQIILECYSEPKSKKKAAEEHAAEGALWYLRHIGY